MKWFPTLLIKIYNNKGDIIVLHIFFLYQFPLLLL